MSKLNILACQIEIPRTRTRAQRDSHVMNLAKKIDRQLCGQTVDLVVLPELATIEYSRKAFDNLQEISDPIETSFCVEVLAEMAKRHEAFIVFGMPRQEAGKHLISQVVITPTGAIAGHYDKIHMCQYGASMEKEYFISGNHLFSFQINGIKIAPIICYDIRFPEITRTLCCDHNVDFILHCGAYARDESFFSWHPFVVTRAMENQCHLLSLNRAGRQFGSSVFCTPWTDEQNQPQKFGNDEEFRLIEISMKDQVSARNQYTFLSDRLDDYSQLDVRSD